MRLPEPAALLVEHPAVPAPCLENGRPEMPSVEGRPVRRSSLKRRDRYRVAVQLTAAAALLADFDLWIEQRALRNAVVTRCGDGLVTRIARFPVPLSRVAARLGGGQGAAEAMRRAVIESVAGVAGLAPGAVDVDRGEPGLFLSGALARQLAELPKPLDTATARSLWMLRWDGLPEPMIGDASYWSVPRWHLARRLAAGLWTRLRRRGRTAWLWVCGTDDRGTIPEETVGREGVLIVAGDVREDVLAALSRWVDREGCSAAAIGSFPAGWHPPPAAGFDADRLSRHLALAGPDPEVARRAVDRRSGRFDPLDDADRDRLTAAARHVFQPPLEPSTGVHDRGPRDELEDWLLLDPDGLPPGFVAVHYGLGEADLERAAGHLPIIESRGRWRLPHRRPLRPAARHLEVAGLYAEDDPRRLLHAALGGEAPEVLEAWVRARLRDLDGAAVRDLLACLAPGALGPGIAALRVEACLSILDLSGARAALDGVSDADRPALAGWLGCVDRTADDWFVDEDTLRAAREPRVAAEIACLQMVRLSRLGDTAGVETMGSLLTRSLEAMSGPVRRLLEIDRVAVEGPQRLEDRQWRRRVGGEHPELAGRVIYQRAQRVLDVGDPRRAYRLLELLQDERLGPGRWGIIENDLGTASVAAGWTRRAEIHHLRAYRLLQSAGFRHATRHVLFNLAVADIDQLRVRQAEEKLQVLSARDPDSPYLIGESSRLALAMGDEVRFRELLGAFEALVGDRGPPFREALAVLRGIAATLDGRLAAARGLLRHGGQEGRVWGALVDAAQGRPSEPDEQDDWGVMLAARCVAEGSAGPATDHGLLRSKGVAAALAVALAVRVAGDAVSVDPGVRTRVVETLRAAGLRGWADQFRDHASPGVVAALAQVVEGAGFGDLGREEAELLVRGLGVAGLEVRDHRSGELLWGHGAGPPGTEVRCGRLAVVPLGGEVTDDPVWVLVKGMLEVFPPAPARPPDDDREAEDTGFLGLSPAAEAVRRDLRALGPSHLPIVILGETGVGKEVAAKAIHRLSGRRGRFVGVNINAIPSNLLEAELFGSVRGAFTGADRSRQGLVMAAHQGTLFLDEIGDLAPPLQVKLLRFLELQEVRPVGSDHSQAVDVRILSATNCDLEARVRDGRFRHDLFYRLAMCRIPIAPLRERREDIEVLAEHFQRQAVDLHGLQPARWSSSARAALRRHPWPGNARELQKTVEVAMVRATGGVVRTEDLPFEAGSELPVKPWDEAQRDFRAAYLTAALRRNGGNRSATARELGISRQALLYHLRNLGLKRPE